MARTIVAIASLPHVRTALRDALAPRCKVWPVASGAAAVRLLREGVRPRLVIAPVRLDGASVLTLRARLDEEPFGRGVPLLVYADPRERRDEAVRLRVAARVVDLPIDPVELIGAVDALAPLPAPPRGPPPSRG